MSTTITSRMADEIHAECVAYLQENPSFVFCEEPEAGRRESLVDEITVICRRYKADPINIMFGLTMPMNPPAGHTSQTVTLMFTWGGINICIEAHP